MTTCKHICFQFLCRHGWTFSLALLRKIVSMGGARTLLRLQLSSRSARIEAPTLPRPRFSARTAPARRAQRNPVHSFTKRGERDEADQGYLFPFPPGFQWHPVQKSPSCQYRPMQRSPRFRRCAWMSPIHAWMWINTRTYLVI